MNPMPTEIVYFALNRWDSMMQREQHLMLGLSRTFRVLFIDPPLSLPTILFEKMRGKKWTLRGDLHWVNNQLAIYTPSAFPPLSQYVGWIHLLHTNLLIYLVKKILKRFNFRNYIVGIGRPFLGGVATKFNPRLSYYDCSDDFFNFPGLKGNREMLKGLEETLLRTVDLVFCSSQKIKEDKSVLHPRCFLISNGIDSPFLEAVREKGDVPEEMKEMRRPVLGYLGTIGEWVDLDALVRLARSRRDWTLVMIGPSTSRRIASALNEIPNLRILGEKRYEELPNYLRHFDVCLIPFRVNDFTRSIYPTKFHQYLGAGKPVVSSLLPDLEVFAPYVEFYSDPKEMEAKIERSLREDSEGKALERRRVASEHTWDRRVESMIKVFREHL